jgi:AcrR family transcriptional regulator
MAATKAAAVASEAAGNLATSSRLRRPRGEPRRLLISAASDIFNDRGYAGASTREIADRAGVSETLMFRHFGTKAGLFRDAMVVPFVQFVERFIKSRQEAIGSGDSEALTREFIGELYDLFRSHRALAALLFAADVHVESELAASGALDEVRKAIEKLVRLGTIESRARGRTVDRQDLSTRTTIAMIAGMATFGSWFFGSRRPSRNKIVEELVQTIMHGRARTG